MRPLRHRSQLIVVAGLFLVYAAGVGSSFYLQARSHARLEAQLHESLAVLSSLPALRDRLRAVEEATGQYLLTGQRQWLDRRDGAIDQVRAIERGLADVVAGREGADRLEDMDRRLTAYLAETGQWVSRRRAGPLAPADAARAARAGSLEAAAAPLSDLGAAQALSLRQRRAELERTSRATVAVILLAGAAGAAFAWLFLARYLTDPVEALRAYARGWTLGSDWSFSPHAASPEVAELASAAREMAERLNAQYAKEAELGRLKGSLVSMASHEFNNALSVLGGTAGLLRATEEPAPAGRRAEYYDVIDANLRSLAIAVSNLLDLGRLEDGRFAVHPRRANPARVLGEVAAALKPLHERKRLAFELRAPKEPLYARADPEALALVATNLIGNAVKYTREGGRVRAGVEAGPDGRVAVFVEDTGIGVAAEDRERILRGHRTDEGKRAARGFGVGLTLVKRVLDAHGTSLSIESEPGKGSRFSFTLPRWEGPTEEDLFQADGPA